jgi:hypothetical protein
LFSREVCAALGHYVYLLLDGDTAFYVGKGQGNRSFQHALAELELDDGETPESAKLRLIRDMRQRGTPVRMLILRHGMKTADEALRVESLLIDLFNGGFRFDLKNLVGGHHASAEGVMTPEEAIALYDCPPIELDDTPLIMFRIPRLWRRGMAADDLYEATRGWWRVDPGRAAKARYALSVSNGIVRAVYRPERWRRREFGEPGWTPSEAARPRFGFEGEPATDVPESWLNRSVAAFLPRGFRGGFRYRNC